jgi:hypothetical protein
MIQNYLFVDGICAEPMRTQCAEFTDVDALNLSLAKIRDGVKASKGFYYDCVDQTRSDEGRKQKVWLDQVRPERCDIRTGVHGSNISCWSTVAN